MKTRTKVLLIALTCMTAFALFAASTLRAGTNSNASGSMWSSNIGWIALNNCTDAANAATCTGPDYGVTIDPATGAVSGTAWSSNIGWITFDNAGCPTAGCSGGASFNAATSTVNGWARACSVFASGCSGALADNAYLGDWDGFLSLSGSGYGLALGAVNGTTRPLSGSIWGSEVIGWVSVQGDAKITTTPVDLCLDIAGTQDQTYLTQQGLTRDANGNCPQAVVDFCLDIAGTQDQTYLTQQGLTRDTNGNCLQSGACPNSPYTHMQKSALPPGYTVNSNGQCVPPGGLSATCQAPYQAYFRNNLPPTLVIDPVTGNCVPPQKGSFCPCGVPKPSNGICPSAGYSCPSGPGPGDAPRSCPNGTTPVSGVCPGGSGGDVCPNIVGIQLAAPAGYTINASNQCVPIGYPDLTDDWCPNIVGVQSAIPANMTVNPQGACVAVKKPIFIEF